MPLGHLGGVLATTIFVWDPFLRGICIIALFVILLPGSVYLVLSTDIGGRLGFLVMAAAMSGMLCLLSFLWMPLSSTADIGRPNSWHPLEIITGNYQNQVTIKGVANLPVDNLKAGTGPYLEPITKTKHWYWPWQSCNNDSWQKIDPSLINDPESASDTILAPATPSTNPLLASPFTATTDYVYVDGYTKGANSGCLFSINRHKVYMPFARSPHYVVLRVLPALPTLTLGGAPATVLPDTSAPYTYVIMDRNLGSVRQPQALLCISMGITFLTICYLLHTREKEKQAKDAKEGEGAGAGTGPVPAEREKVGAGV